MQSLFLGGSNNLLLKPVLYSSAARRYAVFRSPLPPLGRSRQAMSQLKSRLARGRPAASSSQFLSRRTITLAPVG